MPGASRFDILPRDVELAATTIRATNLRTLQAHPILWLPGIWLAARQSSFGHNGFNG